MEKFTIESVLGDGSFGSVLLAKSKTDKKLYAVKKMKKKYKTWQDCMQLRELKSLKKLSASLSQNVVRLVEVIRQAEELFFVFEYMQGNLYQITDRWKVNNWKLSDFQISNCIRQLTDGVAFIHTNGFMHRDMKPENILVSTLPSSPAHLQDLLQPASTVGMQYKIADFGLAREIRSVPPYTDYVSTRWYRAPELLLRSNAYSSSVDVWALGTILFELYKLDAMFPGSSDIDMFYLIAAVLGAPLSTSPGTEWNDWKEGISLATNLQMKLPAVQPKSCAEFQEKLSGLLPSCHPDALVIMRDILRWDSTKRPFATSLQGYKFMTLADTCTSPSRVENSKMLESKMMSIIDPSNNTNSIRSNYPLPNVASSPYSTKPYLKQSSPSSTTSQGQSDAFFSKFLSDNQSKHMLRSSWKARRSP